MLITEDIVAKDVKDMFTEFEEMMNPFNFTKRTLSGNSPNMPEPIEYLVRFNLWNSDVVWKVVRSRIPADYPKMVNYRGRLFIWDNEYGDYDEVVERPFELNDPS